MKHNLTLYRDISRQLNAGCGYFLIFIAILSIYHSYYIKPLYFVGIPLLLAIYMVIERYCYNIMLYILLHGLCFLPFLLIHEMDLYYRVLYIIMLAIETIRALHIWAKGNEKPYNDVPWHILVFATICYLTAHFYNLPLLKSGAYYVGLITLIVHFIRFYITGLNNLMTHSKGVTSMPTKRIMSTNLWLFGFFIIAFLILVGCNKLFGFEQIFYTIGRFLVKCLRIIIKLVAVIAGIIRALKAKDSTFEDIDLPVTELEQAVSEITEPSLIAEIFSKLFVVLFVILLILFLYRIMSELVKKYLSRYAKDTDIVTSVKNETGIVKRTKNKIPLKTRLRQMFTKSYEEKIRQVYRQKILSYKKVKVNPADTARDIADKVNSTYEDNINALTNVYEKARYSDEHVTPDEAYKGGIIC